MLNHTYTSVKNANLVDCGKKQHIPSQPTPLLKENFLGEFRTELDKKKVLAALGIATELSLEWGNINGDIGDSTQLINELDARTTYTSQIEKFKGKVITLIEGIKYLETVVEGELDVENEQNTRLENLEKASEALVKDLETLNITLTESVIVDIIQLQKDLEAISKSVENITSLIQVSAQADNALSLLEGDNPGLYVPDLSGRIDSLSANIDAIQKDVQTVKDDYIKREEFGDGDLDFVSQSDYNSFSDSTNNRLGNLEDEIKNTVKTGEDGHVATLYVNKVSKESDAGNIVITDSFEMESGIPLDVRFVVSTRSDLAKLNVGVCYAGMGVIVKDESALYILREPSNGELTQEFVENIDVNWKCPEDLVTQALTRDEYEALLVVDPETGKNKINPTKFYYVYEKDTEEPKRSNFDSDEAYQEAYNAWLKILSQEYMSATWGVEIEKKVAKKASSADLNDLNLTLSQVQAELADIKGSDATNSLASLGKSIETIQQTTTELEGRLNDLIDINEGGLEVGRIVDLETSVGAVKDSLDDYVTKSDLQDNTQEFIFVKTSTYEDDKETFQKQLAERITTNQVEVGSINTESLSLNDANIKVDVDHLTINDKQIALSEDLMQVEIIDQDTYNKREQAGTLSDKIYYYTYDGTVSLVTNTELQRVKDDIRNLQSSVDQLQQDIAALQQIVQGSNQTT